MEALFCYEPKIKSFEIFDGGLWMVESVAMIKTKPDNVYPSEILVNSSGLRIQEQECNEFSFSAINTTTVLEQDLKYAYDAFFDDDIELDNEEQKEIFIGDLLKFGITTVLKNDFVTEESVVSYCKSNL